MNVRKIIYVVLIVSICCGGALLRFKNIGGYSFWTDEFFAVYAAKSQLNNQGFYVPYEGEHPYRKLVVYITAYMFKNYGESETTARVPFAFANLIFIMVAYKLFSMLFCRRIAVIICAMMAFSPLFIYMSRECRSYTLHQLFFFLSAVTFFWGYEYKKPVPVKIPYIAKALEKKFEINILLIALAIVFGYVAKNLQPLTYNLAFVVYCYSITMVVINNISKGISRQINCKYYIFLIVLPVGICFQYFFNNDHFNKMLMWATNLPEWATYRDFNIHYYRWYLSDKYPVFTYFYPIGIYFLIKSYKEKGIFIFLLFFIPFLLHSFVYPLKSDRYIFYVLPYFFIGFSGFVNVLFEKTREILKTAKVKPIEKSVILLCIIPITVLVLKPWFGVALKAPFTNKFPNWFAFQKPVKEKISHSVIITTRPREFLYYFGKKPEYSIVNEIPKNYYYNKDLIDNSQYLKEVISKYDSIYLLSYRSHLKNENFFNKAMIQVIKEEMQEIDGVKDRSFILLKKNE